jgi:hypothetical protein
MGNQRWRSDASDLRRGQGNLSQRLSAQGACRFRKVLSLNPTRGRYYRWLVRAWIASLFREEPGAASIELPRQGDVARPRPIDDAITDWVCAPIKV